MLTTGERVPDPAPTVLVVDADDGTRELLEVVLRGAGYQVTLAGTSRDALDRLDAANPALVLLDLMMPCMSGAVLASEMQRRGLGLRVPMLVVSAHPHSRRLAAQLGAAGCVEKPFGLTALLDEVGRLLTSAN